MLERGNPLKTTNIELGAVSSRVALLLRSAEAKPWFSDLFMESISYTSIELFHLFHSLPLSYQYPPILVLTCDKLLKSPSPLDKKVDVRDSSQSPLEKGGCKTMT